MENIASITEYDTRTRRCPMLGNEVPFNYCRQPASPLPCRRVLDCWWEIFDVLTFAEKHFSQEALRHVQSAPQPKAETLLGLIEETKKRLENQNR